MGQAMEDQYLLHPLKAIGAGLAVNLSYVALFWLCSGFGGWGRTWAISLDLGLLLVIAMTILVSTLHPQRQREPGSQTIRRVRPAGPRGTNPGPTIL